MTREEAIEVLNDIKRIRSNKITEACNIAISALYEEEQDLWIEKNSHTYICHNCGFEQAIYGNLEEYKYCPHCGKPKKGYECGWRERLFCDMFTESTEAYKEWTGEDMGATNCITESPNEVVEKNDEVIDHDRKWIIGCIKHDGFIKTDRFDKANQIILEALEPTEPSDLISRADAIEAICNCQCESDVPYYPACDQVKYCEDIQALLALPSADTVPIHEDGTLEVKVPNAQKVGRVLVMDTDSHIGGGLFYPDDAERVGVWIRKEEELNDCDGHRAYYWQECSECGARPPKDQWKNEWHSPYCPNCGAKMKGGTE